MKNKIICRKILSLLLVFSLLVGMMPMAAFATEQEVVYISVSYDAKYINDKNGNPMAYVAVPFEDVAAVDLNDYELGEYLYDADGDGSYETTALQLIIYAHENIYGGSWSDVTFTGGAGSSYFQGGIFGFDENLNYYLNGEYPIDKVMTEQAGYDVGATSDHIVLEAGDFINVGSFTSWSFFSDSNYGFHFFADGEGAITHSYTVEEGKDLSVKLIRAFSGMGSGAAVYDEAGYTIYYGASHGSATGNVTTDDAGNAAIKFDTEGTYYVWANGGYGNENPTDIVSTPAYAKVTVTKAETPQIDEAVQTVIDKIDAIGEVTLESETTITEARSAYDALTDAQKALVTNVDTLTAAEDKLNGLKADKEAADDVIAKIDAIGEVSLDSASVIATARSAYNALTDAQKALVTNVETLTVAEDKLNGLKADKEAADDVIVKIDAIGEVSLDSASVIATARSAYNALTDAQKALVTNVDTLTAAEDKLDELLKAADEAQKNKVAAESVIGKINAIGNVTLDSTEVIESARSAYDALTDAQKELVTNLNTLTSAEKQLKKLEADKAAADDVILKINDIGEVTLGSVSVIATARSAYDTLTDDQKALVTNADVLIKAEQQLKKLQDEKITADKKAAADVDDLIEAIGTVSIYNVAKVTKARDAYDNLTADQEVYVTKLDTLVKAEQTLDKLYEDAAKIDHKVIYNNTNKHLQTLGTPMVGSIGGEWMVMDLTRAGYDCPEGYYENVEEYVKAKINDKEQLHRSKGTDNSRVILALTSAGYDVTDVAGHNLLTGLTDMNYVIKQGINGPIWALIAFDSHSYEIPTNPDATEQVTREGLIRYILDNRVDDGGWNLMLYSEVCDPDITGMAIQALAPYYDTDAEVKAAVDGALETLSNIQHENGGYSTAKEGICSESCAQVIVALTSLGINPETDARFIKNGISVVDAMCTFAVEGGGFAHVPNGGLNGMATEQSQYALASYFRFLNGQTSLYDMTDVQIRKVENLPTIDTDKPSDKVEIGTNEESKEVLDETLKEILTNIEDDKKVTNINKEVVEAIKKAVEEGKKVEVSVSILIENVDAKDAESEFGKEDIALVEKAASKMTIVQYFDISVLLKVKADGQEISQGTVSKLKDKITVTIAIPESLKDVEEGTVRNYYIIRVHEGKVDKLDTKVNSDGTLSFETDCFSTYAVTYEDTAKTETPKTGDTNNVISWIVLMIITTAGFVSIRRKEN